MWVGESNNATDKVARSLIKFDLSSIPSNATITSATLSLWTDADFSDNDRMIRVYRLKVPFDELQATWNESATGVSWQSVGASGTNDRESTDIGSVQILANEAIDVEKQISLSTSKIQELINGTFTNNGFVLAVDTETDDRFNYKASDATAQTKRPKLVIQYTLPQGKAPSDRFAFVNYILPKPLQQSGSLSFTPIDDAHIFNASPSNNYGSATTLQVDDSPVKHFLLKFDVTGVNGQTITNAKIRLYNVDAASAGGKFYHVGDDSWQEETVTWNTAPTADTNLLGQLGAVSANTWYEVDVTSLVTSDGTYSFRISDSTGGADYSSKEGANAPELVLTLGGTPPPTNTPTPGPSPTPSKTPTPSATSVVTATPSHTPTPTAPSAFSSTTFVYDGDGKRVKSVINSSITTYFVGTHYEVANGVVTKYYYAGSQRIAMRVNGTLNYLLGDHLGSTSLTTSATGTVISELRYKAWGETRYASGTAPTKYQYTGQYSYASDFGLMFYNARWYDSSIGRFAQADTIVPSGIQGYDRYAYVNNNPVRYTDPTGHRCADGDEDLWGYCDYTPRLNGMLIPRAIDDFFDIKDDPVELITRAILGEQGEKLFTDKEDDAVGVAWAIRNRAESRDYYIVNRDGSWTANGEYNWYWSANSQIYGMTTMRAHDPLNSGYWKTRDAAIRAYNHAREIALQVLGANKSQDITHGAIRWADQGLRPGQTEMKWGEPVKTAYGYNPNCINCIQYNRTHFDNDYVSDPNPYNPNRSSWCVMTVPLSECQE